MLFSCKWCSAFISGMVAQNNVIQWQNPPKNQGIFFLIFTELFLATEQEISMNYN